MNRLSKCIIVLGIIGRTGSGKTSIINALLQMYYTSGLITIDGIDVSSVNKEMLRSKISVIPQEALIFTGTVRYNLDPTEDEPEELLRTALTEVDLRLELDGRATDLSVGEKQLLCLARAIVRRSSVLILDEATASLDPETDRRMQEAIRHHFADCTVLIVAHRLQNVMDVDRLMILEDGIIKEFDQPFVLLKNPKSHLNFILRDTDKEIKHDLHRLAKTVGL